MNRRNDGRPSPQDEPTGGASTNCARPRSNGISPSSPRARCWCRWDGPGFCARPRWRSGFRRGCGGAARDGSPPSTRCFPARPASGCPARRPRASSRVGPRRSSGSSDDRCARCATWWRLGELQITVDCDVLQADGGTRTASICGAYVALHDALTRLVQKGTLRTNPLTEAVAAVSVGVVDGVCMLDLPYEEDSRAEVDMNVVMTSSGPLHRGAGHGRGHALHQGRARRDAEPGRARASPSSSTCRPRPWPSRRLPAEPGAMSDLASGSGHRQSGQGRRDHRDPRGRPRAWKLRAPTGIGARSRRDR